MSYYDVTFPQNFEAEEDPDFLFTGYYQIEAYVYDPEVETFDDFTKDYSKAIRTLELLPGRIHLPSCFLYLPFDGLT